MKRHRRKPRHMIFCCLCQQPIALGIFHDSKHILTSNSVPDMICDDCTTDLMIEDATHELRCHHPTVH